MPMILFHSLTFCTSYYILSNITFHYWIKVLLFHSCNCFLVTKMPWVWNIMHLFQCKIPKLIWIKNMKYFLCIIILSSYTLYFSYLYYTFFYCIHVHLKVELISYKFFKNFVQYDFHMPIGVAFITCNLLLSVYNLSLFPFNVLAMKTKFTNKFHPSCLPNI